MQSKFSFRFWGVECQSRDYSLLIVDTVQKTKTQLPSCAKWWTEIRSWGRNATKNVKEREKGGHSGGGGKGDPKGN